MRTSLVSLIIAAAMLASSPLAPAAEFNQGGIKISQPWTRATPGAVKVGGAYMTITNTGLQPDRLLGGSTPIADVVEIHEMAMSGNVMKMRRLPRGLEIGPGKTVKLKPGGYHVMLIGLKQPIKQGDPVKGTLRFERAGPVAIEFQVAPIGAMTPDQTSSGGKGAADGTHH